jgi:hypothetical protein
MNDDGARRDTASARVGHRGLLVLWLLLGSGCRGNECDFIERCDGNVRQLCGHSDQIFGRKVRPLPCEAPTPACAQINEATTYCARDLETTCDDSFDESCEGSMRVSCGPFRGHPPGAPRYVTVQDCAEQKHACVDLGNTAACQ